MPIVVDRIEGDIAVLDADGRTYDVPVGQLPAGVEEGWALRLGDDDCYTRVDAEAGAGMGGLMADDDGGDFSL